MKLMKYVFIICLLVGNAFAYAAEESDYVQDLLKAETPKNAELGETAVLADALQFSIPEDWESSSEYDDEELCSFLFKGADAEGRSVLFFGMEARSESLGAELSSYIDLKKLLDEAESDYRVSTLNGIDMLFKFNDEIAVGMGLTKDAEFFAFGFTSEKYGIDEILESDKLKADMISILHSMKLIDADRLMPFDASMWEQSSERTEKTSSVKKSELVNFFEDVTTGWGVTSKSHPVCLNEALVVYVPYDWLKIEDEQSRYIFKGTDENNNSAAVTVDVVSANGMTQDDLEEEAEKQIVHCTTKGKEIQYITYISRSSLVTAWLADDGNLYTLTANLDSEDVMRSEKLIGDLHQIMCRLRPVRDDDLELNRTLAIPTDADHTGETPVSFRDAEFEQMVRAAMNRRENVPIYPTELEVIQNISIRSGTLLFSSETQYGSNDNQSGVLNLADLKLFPNLVYLYIADMNCAGFEILPELSELRQLLLIRTGLTDCGFLSGMTLTELDLAGNDIVDFTPITKVKGLKELNVSYTGLESLEFIRDMDLTLLAVAGDPISDLEPISNMSGLTCLYIQDTDISSLEPLYEHDNLKQIFYWGITLSDKDRQKFGDILW